MDYETGSASSPSDLLTKLATFAAGDGWTVNTPASGLVFLKGSAVVGVNGAASTVDLRGALSYDAGLAWNDQPNNSGVTTQCDVGAGPFTAYHFFSVTEENKHALHVAVEISAGHFRHFSFGELIKHGSYTGGVYVDSVNWNNSTIFQNIPDSQQHQVICDANGALVGTGHVWIDYDSKSNNWQRVFDAGDTTPTRCSGSVRSGGMDQMFANRGYLRWNLRNVPAPLTYFANRASSLKSFIGRIPHMRVFGMHNLSPGETVTIGGDSWLVFPIIQRTDTWGSSNSTTESSGYYGYGYRLP